MLTMSAPCACGAPLVYPGRGRPPTRCADCRRPKSPAAPSACSRCCRHPAVSRRAKLCAWCSTTTRNPPRPPRPCLCCGWSFVPKSHHTRYCSDRCRWGRPVESSAIRLHPCTDCGTAISRPRAEVCRPCAADRLRAHYSAKGFERRALVAAGERFTAREIAERDGWCCHLCAIPIPDRPYTGHPLDLTIDHLVPVVLGGAHTRANVRAAHRFCNLSRGARPLG